MKQEFLLHITKWKETIKQFRYPLLILLLGVFLMLFPMEKKQMENENVESQMKTLDLTAQMEELLSLVEGAGRVRVLLTLESGPISHFQEDVRSTTDAQTTQMQTETVLVSGEGKELPLTVKMTYPTYKGAVIICQGADHASVRLNLIRAVSSLTGLSSDQITVVKMQRD